MPKKESKPGKKQSCLDKNTPAVREKVDVRLDASVAPQVKGKPGKEQGNPTSTSTLSEVDATDASGSEYHQGWGYWFVVHL